MKITKFKGNPRYFNAKGLAKTDRIIENVHLVKVNEEERVTLQFEDEERELKLTPHQVSALARAYGEDTDKWIGEKVTLDRTDEGKGIVLTAHKSDRKPASQE